MLKRLYHGSENIIQKPQYGFGKQYDDYGLGILDLNDEKYCILHWLSILLLNGTISYRQLNRAMHLGKLGQQFVLKSKKSFGKIQYLGHEFAECNEWYAKKMLRDRTASREYFDVERNKRERGDIYIVQIMDEEMKTDDLRI